MLHRVAALLMVLLPLAVLAEEPFAPVQESLPVPAPEGAIVLFDGAGTNHFVSMAGDEIDWPVREGALVSTRGNNRSNHIVSTYHFRDADLHVEFRLPENSKGNSGVYLHGHYELQIFNSHGKDEPGMGDMGAVYAFSKPLVNAARPPGEWQVYDIRYRAPRRDEDGQIVESGRITAWLNGQLVQDKTPVSEPRSNYHPFRYGTTPYLEAIEQQQMQTSVGPVFLQDHDSPVQFRNVWVRPLDDRATFAKPTADARGD
ncbi:hypothetical protein Mal4_29380 [Maioricimonas rarisocia]|uniref:3-keto-alpha-glucoside-1,2-lyase/3-keto-2-hydroxy-glucal hydratase domain-containing protein n=1 Tax=Maioricimonas rarisocia TaxID=2528026 RepID=A0A517Z834_9PLAN|nr:DUF1080 domain-containing protein [Maioricimonas rarisocia]QDU38609.1 hypothetical protein Mal4_29380 [Maioricimonas rarisocia]